MVGDQQQTAAALHPVAHGCDFGGRERGRRGRWIVVPVRVAGLRVGDDQHRACGERLRIEGGTARHDHVAVATQQRSKRVKATVERVEVVVRLVQADHRALAFGEGRRRYRRCEVAIGDLLREAGQAGGQQKRETGEAFHRARLARWPAGRMCQKAPHRRAPTTRLRPFSRTPTSGPSGRSRRPCSRCRGRHRPGGCCAPWCPLSPPKTSP